MRPELKKLLNHLASADYSAEDVITIIEGLKPHMRARYDFMRSETPEAEALARWALDDTRKAWHETCRTYHLHLTESDWYF